MKWTDKDGLDYEIEYMTDLHLSNALNFISRLMAHHSNYMPPPIYNCLLKEYERRANE